MKNIESKIFAQFMAGIFGGTITGFVTLFHSYKYTPSVIAAITGATLGVIIISRVKATNYTKIAIWLGVGSFIIPFLYIAVPSLKLLQYIEFSIFMKIIADKGVVMVFIILFYLAIAAIISLFLVGIINWKKILGLKK